MVLRRELMQVVNELMENEKMVQDYERLSSDLLEWIKQRIALLNDRQFHVSFHLLFSVQITTLLRTTRVLFCDVITMHILAELSIWRAATID